MAVNLEFSVPPAPAGMAADLAGLELLLKASADTLRLQILQVLQHEAYGVLELCALFGVKQSAMSHHLKVLANAGLVSARREGNRIFYRRSLPAATAYAGLTARLFLSLDQLPLGAALSHAVDTTQQEREKRSLQFFADNEQLFEAQQELITRIGDYREPLLELLDALPVGRECCWEIGPGEGHLLVDLATRFSTVVAADASPRMIAACEQRVRDLALDNVRFVTGKTSAAALDNAPRPDAVIASMVLHHNAQPDRIFADVGRALLPGGAFVVVELGLHHQEWVRDAAGDVWLGFSAEQLDDWADSAGLVKGLSNHNALRNGFRIQIHSYHKPADRNPDE